MKNSWGPTWADEGRAWMSLAVLQELLDADGEALAAVPAE